MDPVSITLGVLPLAAGAIKISTSIHKRLKVFRHYSSEVKRIRKQVDLQQRFFVNEAHLILRLAVADETEIKAMLKNATHAQWSSPELESALREELQESLEPCTEVVGSVMGALESIEDELQCFNKLMEQRTEGEKLTDAVRRLRDRTKISWDKSKFEKHIKSLRDSTDDLRRLREQAIELRKPRPSATTALACSTADHAVATGHDRPRQLNPEYREYGTVRKASKAFHQALALAWSRTPRNPTAKELRHAVKLFLDTQVKDEVIMDVAVLCYGHAPDRALMGASLTRLRVRSQNMDWVKTGLATPPATAADAAAGEDRRKRRRVHFADATAPSPPEPRQLQFPVTPTSSLSPSNSVTATCQEPSDLLCAQDVCSILGRCAPCDAASSAECLGYIDTCAQGSFDHSFRHSFYSGFKDRSEQALFQSAICHNGLISMDEVLHHSAETSLSIVDQLKLARNLVAAVLKFYSTPWLGDYFSLGDVCFFRLRQDIPGCLQTLHLGFEFVHGSSTPDATAQVTSATMEGVVESSTSVEAHGDGPSSTTQLAVAAENAKLYHGVRNLTLWSLGTMMLQIGMWARLDRVDDVPAVRKLCSRTPPLGPRYQELTKKCLDCDFGYGDDLSKPRLQQAVYEGLVCELNKMIGSLDISGD